MNKDNINEFASFDEYLRQGEPSQKESAENWKTAIGLQAVDGLQPSAYLIDVAKRNIEGEITLDETRKLIDSYYQSKTVRTPKDEDEEEADKVSANIAKILASKTFAFNTNGYVSLHRRIFEGVFKHAGEIRQYDISKKEWVLEGDSVNYLNWEDLRRALDWDIEQEKNFSYKGLTDDEKIEHIAKFISGIWQIHAFREGNTRTTAIFTIQYLRSLGYEVNNEMFAKHSWYFRNALVRANYRNINKDIEYSPIYLVRFFRNLLLGESWVLKNRYLHIDPTDEWKVQPRLATPQVPHTPHQKVDRKGGQKTEKVGRKGGQKTKDSILSLIASDPFVTTNEMSKRLEINRSAISKHIKKLKEDHIIERIGPDKGGKWLIKK
ncbi:Fic family protein [Segatella copri]|uniref:protein adenylyltransferase n=1 Tax=Segatella copri TaxID=165179 RepID=A0AAW9T7C4_9BACT|nr:Fic family protein [Segatella copri]MQN26680.1 winged helix-turn-helix transcriptional regulator [Segatella copri]MQN31045.1 winged helix-turn-helix transcriptional regulator [Segatella copri]MQN37979.1 winged helix-turn-helix transcriptional regulator [Segatella copri]MQN74107.1 winged helix-turn-helix transcriptional regulator [Segatella copri]MQO25632.1 winged helix-turn-helix transcriptional regulator [Segatella copri]